MTQAQKPQRILHWLNTPDGLLPRWITYTALTACWLNFLAFLMDVLG